LEGCGFVLKWDILDAASLLPQKRKRLYIIGIRSDEICESGCIYTFPVLPDLGRGVRDVLQQTSGDKLTSHQRNKVQSQAYTKKFPEGTISEQLVTAFKDVSIR
jgi:site-specific DNA-cytosine methylase